MSISGEGYAAYAKRIPLEDNPYKDGPEYKYKEWMYGWLDASHRRMVESEKNRINKGP